MQLIKTSRIAIAIVAFIVSACGGGGGQVTRKLGVYNLKGDSFAFDVWRDGDRLCDKHSVKGDIWSAKLAENFGIQFIDNEKENSYIEIYSQDKKCFEADLFSKILFRTM